METNYLDEIKKFDKQIDEYVKNLSQNIKNIEFDKSLIKEFNFSEEIKIDFPKSKGIYFFEININDLYQDNISLEEKIYRFVNEWIAENLRINYCSNIVHKRINIDKIEEGWLPLYIGKCKNINKRVNEHFNLASEKKTYAMKLKQRINLNKAKFRVSYLPLEVDNYDFIAPHLESILREEFSPIVGKQ